MPERFENNIAESRFEYHKDGFFAYADYRIDGGTLYIDYVFAPPELRGTGAASTLMQHIAAKAQADKLMIEPICGYAAAWLQRYQSSQMN